MQAPCPLSLSLSRAGFGLSFLLAAALPAAAQTLSQPTLRADIEQGASEPSTSLTYLLATSGGHALLGAKGSALSLDLWVTDDLGLSATPIQQTDQGLGLVTSAVSTRDAAALPNGHFVVRATVGGLGAEPIVIDPAGPTATLLADLVPGIGSSVPESLVSWSGEVWFTASDGVSRSLYSTDGTAAGTVLRSALPSPSNLSALVATPGCLFVAVRASPFLSIPTDALYSLASPGSALALVQPGTVDAPFFNDIQNEPVLLGSQVLFGLDDGSTGTEPWISDGTPQGTSALADISPGNPGSSPRFIEQLNGTGLFAAMHPDLGTEYYLTDGTAGGTQLLGDLAPGVDPGAVSPEAAVVGGQFLLSVYTADTGQELWTAGTTPGSAALVTDLFPGLADSAPKSFQVFGGLAYFGASTSATGAELYVSDGTPQGTGLAAEIVPGQSDSMAEPLATMPWGLLLEATGPSGREPYASDGTSTGTVLLANTIPEQINGPSSPRNFVRFQDRVVFGAETQELGRELYQLRLGEAQAELLADLEPGAASGGARPLVATDDFFLFTKSTPIGSSGSELWSSTGAPGSELKLIDLGLASSVPPAARLGDEAYVISRLDGQSAPSLLRTDGTVAGTTVVLDGLDNMAGPMVEFGGSLWFRAAEPGTGFELWKTDGTTAGTGFVQELAVGPTGGTQLIVATETWLAVAGSLFSPAIGLFAFGPQGNSAPIGSSISAGSQDFSVVEAAAFEDQLIFSARNSTTPNKTGIYVSDGTDAGTFELSVTSPGETLTETQGFVGAGNRAYFWTRTDGDQLWKLWTTQGSQSDTVLIGNYQLDTFGQVPLNDTIVDGAPLGSSGQAAYALRTVDKITRLFVASPVPGGLTLPGTAEFETVSTPFDEFKSVIGVRLGSELLFSASDQEVGFELHALPIIELDGYVAETYGSSCGSAQIGSQDEARVGSTLSVELGAQPLSPAGLFISAEIGFQNIAPGCQALIGASTLLANRVTDGDGEAQVDLTIPAVPSLAGVAFYSQWAVLSAGGPVFGLVELTEGLEVVLGN